MTRILNSEFVRSVAGWNQLSDLTFPEVAFVGRSNVGKSSLLNAICERKSLAVTSKTPGRTQMLNYFRITLEPEREVHFVDLPGYGYAEVSKAKQKSWAEFVTEYLLEREELALILLLVDCRRDIEAEEEWVLSLADQVPVCVVLTKCDKLSRGALAKKLETFTSEEVFPTAASKKQGIGDLVNKIGDVVSG